MARPKVFVTRQIFQEVLDMIAPETEMEVWPEEYPPPPDALRQKVRGVDGVLTNLMDVVDGALLDAASNLKVISQLAVGLDNIDVAEATRRRIPVGYTPDVVSQATADHTFALLLAAARRVSEAERWVRKGSWKIAFHPQFWLGAEVHNATLGIVGMGRIGWEVAKRARAFNMKLLYYSHTPKADAETLYSMSYVDLHTLLKESDYVSLHVPLTEDTRYLIGERELRLMKPTAILINTARGAVVDPKALYQALKERWIRAAALDVTEPEPIPADDPLLTLENLVVTPHVGTATVTTRKRMYVMAAKNLLAGLKGEPLPWCANPEVYAESGL